MKRADIKVGEEYAVLAPSQVPVQSWTTAKHVKVLDTKPVWRADGTSSWSSHKAPIVRSTWRGQRVNAKDYTSQVQEGGWGADEAKRSVKVLVREVWGFSDRQDINFYIKIVPVSQVRMLYSEFEKQQAKAKRARDAEWKRRDDEREAAEKLHDERDRQVKELNDRLTYTPGISAIQRDGKLCLTGDFAALTSLVQVFINA